jgi:allantoate deiminase
MDRRSDALAAAAEWICAVESAGAATEGLVATVGEISVASAAVNVVPAKAVASLDVRHLDDRVRDSAVESLRAEAIAAGAARGVAVDWRPLHSTVTLECDERLTARLEEVAAAVTSGPLPRIYSGAGHDGVMLSTVAPIAMLFVRCEGGISHHPAESVREADVGVALEVTTRLLEELAS